MYRLVSFVPPRGEGRTYRNAFVLVYNERRTSVLQKDEYV
jgi:hypothetical protein